MLPFGIALYLANVFIQLATFCESSPGTKTVKKCCPWGMSFDANALICRHVRGVTLSVNRDTYQFAFGVPECLDTVLYTVAYRDFDPDDLRYEDEYCVDGNGDETILVRCGDPSAVCGTRPCIRKCKPLGEFYVGEENATESTEDGAFSVVFYNLTTLLPDKSVNVSRVGVLFGLSCEDGKIRLDDGTSDVNYLGSNGSLYVPGHQVHVFERNKFCMENVQGEGTFAFLCLEQEKEPEDVEYPILLGMGFIASCVCLFAMFFVYLCSHQSKNLYGKTLMFYVGCLCIAYLSLAIVRLGNDVLSQGTCVALGYSILLSFLGAFFWLNVMSIDIWKTFRPLEAAEWRKTHNNRSRFAAYSIYAWGTPLLITVICGVLDALPRTEANSGMDMFRPNIGLSSCWFSSSTYGMYVFFVVPVSLIIVCNIVLYVNTIWWCWKVKAEITRLGHQSGRSGGKYSVHREQLLLNGKLFIVMGVSWGPEFISTILPHPLWRVTDALNSLLGVFIFIIFVLKKKVIDSVTQRVRNSLRSLSKREHQPDYIKKKVCNADTGKTFTTTTTM